MKEYYFLPEFDGDAYDRWKTSEPDYEQQDQEDRLWPWLADESMADEDACCDDRDWQDVPEED